MDFGLERIQFSGFSGKLGKNKTEELFLKITDVIKEGAGEILILPVYEKDIKNVLEYIREGDNAKSDSSGYILPISDAGREKDNIQNGIRKN